MTTGRPLRNRFEKTRTKFWTAVVYKEIAERGLGIDEVLGTDGKWNNIWSRYHRGLVAPSKARLMRIDKALPGTKSYYSAPLWSLWTRDQWSWANLLRSRYDLPPIFQQAFDLEDELREADRIRLKKKPGPTSVNDIWYSNFFAGNLLTKSFAMIQDRRIGIGALSAILMMLYESKLRGDVVAYFCLSAAWAQAERERHKHPFLHLLPLTVFNAPLTEFHSVEWPDVLAPLDISKNLARQQQETSTSSKDFDVLRFLQQIYAPNFVAICADFLTKQEEVDVLNPKVGYWPPDIL
ncbi:hypothetical protein [Herbaspirillum hiltneri]|nr:hypothetical protein [Herbaspirillum hiltneri]